MVKEPRPGRVKTRLGRDIGMVASAWWYRQQTRGLLRRLRDPRWRIVLSVAPDKALNARGWPADLARMPQGTGALGKRMARALGQTQGPTILIGSDIPGVTRAHIARAFQGLRTAGSVVGPATDGGYWLVGLDHPKKRVPNLFQGVRWSTQHTLNDTLETLPKPVSFADELTDVDTVSDLFPGKSTPGSTRRRAPRSSGA